MKVPTLQRSGCMRDHPWSYCDRLKTEKLDRFEVDPQEIRLDSLGDSDAWQG